MAKEIFLTRGMKAIVDDCDYERINSKLWSVRKAGDTYYAQSKSRNDKGEVVTTIMHRLILNVVDPNVFVDHIDRNGLNNRRENIRTCTHDENMRNKKAHGSSSIYKGVDYQEKRSKTQWRARIVGDGKRHYIGNFSTEIEAAMAYNNAAKVYHKEFASLNNTGSSDGNNQSTVKEPARSGGVL